MLIKVAPYWRFDFHTLEMSKSWITQSYLLAVPGCIWLYQAVPGCTRLYLTVPGWTRLYLAVPGCTWLYQAVSSCTRLDLPVPSCYWLYLALLLLICTLLQMAEPDCTCCANNWKRQQQTRKIKSMNNSCLQNVTSSGLWSKNLIIRQTWNNNNTSNWIWIDVELVLRWKIVTTIDRYMIYMWESCRIFISFDVGVM